MGKFENRWIQYQMTKERNKLSLVHWITSSGVAVRSSNLMNGRCWGRMLSLCLLMLPADVDQKYTRSRPEVYQKYSYPVLVLMVSHRGQDIVMTDSTATFWLMQSHSFRCQISAEIVVVPDVSVDQVRYTTKLLTIGYSEMHSEVFLSMSYNPRWTLPCLYV